MKTTLVVLFASFTVLESSNANVNVGYVDLQKALQTVEAGRNAKETLEKDVASKKGEIEKQQKQFQKEAEAFEKKAAIMNDTAKAAKQAELQKKYVELQKVAAESQMELQKRERELTKPIIDELKSIIAGVGKEKNYQLVLEKNEGGVLFAEDNLDLTRDVIDRFNTKNKGKGKDKKKSKG